MSRYFAVPFLVAVLWGVSIRWMIPSANGEAGPRRSLQSEPPAPEILPVAPQVVPPIGTLPEPAPAPQAPATRSQVVEVPAPPTVVRVEVIERPQTTIIVAPTNVYYPVEVVPPPPPEPPRIGVTEIIIVCPLHRRPCSCDRPVPTPPGAWPKASNFMKPSISSFMPPAKMPSPGVTGSRTP